MSSMELQLSLSLIPTKPFHLNINSPSFDFNLPRRKKRILDVDPSSPFPRTLPLLLWNDHPNDGDDDANHLDSVSDNSDEEEEVENELVGWPPLKKRRKMIYMQKHGGRRRGRVAAIRRPAVENGGEFYRDLNSNLRYVKVKMEGVGIARKVDLSQYRCFAALKTTLLYMFDETDSDAYKLTYQDINGHWLLAEDVTWRNFIETVQRIKLEKNNG